MIASMRFRGTRPALLAVLLLILLPVALLAQAPESRQSPQTAPEAGLEEILSGSWGSGPSQLGLRFPEPGVMPAAPFQGPGGFRPAPDGKVWISDSVNARLIGLGSGTPQTIPVAASGLGDIELLADTAFVCTTQPQGIAIIDLKAGKQINHLALPVRIPHRLFVSGKNRIAISEPGGGIWALIDGKPQQHPAKALEPIGTKDHLFGTLFDFDQSSRKIIKAEWQGENDEPTLFAIFRAPGENLVYSRLYGMWRGAPVLGFVSASEPTRLQFAGFDETGKSSLLVSVPLLDGPSLPSSWLIGYDGALYGFSGDADHFRLHRCTLAH